MTDVEIIDLILSILDSPYTNHLGRQFVFASITKISSRPTTSNNQQERIAAVLAGYTTNPELELQQRAVEFASLFSLGELRVGVLERMPPPELKATVSGIGTSFVWHVYFDTKVFCRVVSENKPVGSTKTGKDVRNHVIWWFFFPDPRFPLSRPIYSATIYLLLPIP